VAVVPDDDGRMIEILFDHLANQLRADLRIISMMPAGKLIEYKDAERVTDIEKMIVRRIVRHPNGVHVHIFYQLHVLDAERLTQRPAGGRPEGMTADALELYFYVIDIDA